MANALLWSLAAMVVLLFSFYPVSAWLGGLAADFVVWAIPFTGGAVAAYLAPARKFRAGGAATALSVVLTSVGSYTIGALGYGDFVGWEGTLIGTLLFLPIFLIFGLGGAAIGQQFSERRSNA